MNILLIDADSTIPNLALMKLSAHHKQLGDEVTLIRLNIPYYPRYIKKDHIIDTSQYDKIYCSVIFKGNKQYIHGDRIEYGGTGTEDIKKCLPEFVEQLDPDYSIYPDNPYSYGFISRGCIRNCSFCFVPKKEGYIRQVSTVDRIVHHPITKFMDNNILALPNHKEILQELVDKHIKCQFNQGLDLRLIDEENSKLLSQMNYFGEYIFAFDNWAYKDFLEKKLKMVSWRKDWQLKFFVYVHPDMPISDTTLRVKWLKDHKCLPYVMRDISCWDSSNTDFYTDFASYCNQVSFFKKKEFSDYIHQRHPKGSRADASSHIYTESVSLS